MGIWLLHWRYLQRSHSIVDDIMRAASAFATLLIILSVATALGCVWYTNQRAMSVFDARTDGFNKGIAFARAQQEFEGKMGLCVYAHLACEIRKPVK